MRLTAGHAIAHVPELGHYVNRHWTQRIPPRLDDGRDQVIAVSPPLAVEGGRETGCHCCR